jgi:hypothetical protein
MNNELRILILFFLKILQLEHLRRIKAMDFLGKSHVFSLRKLKFFETRKKKLLGLTLASFRLQEPDNVL